MSNRIRWRGDGDSSTNENNDSRSSNSDRSGNSYSTAPTMYTLEPESTLDEAWDSELDDDCEDSKESVQTYASTHISEEEEELWDDEDPAYELVDFPEGEHQFDPTLDAIPSTPRDFANLFPSSRRLSIRHDDSTIDGNMNLRVDTLVEPHWSATKVNYTLFHLRMQDLKNREFSLRRYCRDSGREVCHSVRKYQTPADRHPALQKSFSSAIGMFKRHTDSKSSGVGHQANDLLRRTDSGYGSIHDEPDWSQLNKYGKQQPPVRMPTNTIKLEFSNYAHVNVKRRGPASNKRYEFDYWGHSYAWKRHVTWEGSVEEVSFHLIRDDKREPLAHIIPVPFTTHQAEEERLKGGWVPECSMWLTDNAVINASSDIAEYV